VPIAPTAASVDSSTQLATTAFVQAQKISTEFTGVPTAPTATAGTSNTQIATTAFVSVSPIFTGIPVAPTAAAADSSTQLATTAFVQAQKISPILTGIPVAPTAAAADSSTQLATTAFVQAQKISPVLTGIPVAPTAAAADSSTQLATTAFVQAQKISTEFTGVPTAPTADPSTSNTQIATTAFVVSITGALGTLSQQNANAVAITGGSVTDITDLAILDGGTGASTADDARTNLGLGSLSQQNANAVAITGGSVTGITDLAIADGGTGASTAADARTNLGISLPLAITSGGTGLTSITANHALVGNSGGTGYSSIAPGASGNVLISNGTAWASSPAFISGMIIMWSGSIVSIPTGWLLCNGTSGTPNLMNRMVLGAGDQYAVSEAGGAATTTITTANLPSHTHTYSSTTSGQSATHTHAVTDPGHSHITSAFFNNLAPPAGWGSPYGSTPVSSSDQVVFYPAYSGPTQQSITGITIGNASVDHDHSVSGTTAAAGSGTAATTISPYYALAYIMKS